MVDIWLCISLQLACIANIRNGGGCCRYNNNNIIIIIIIIIIKGVSAEGTVE